MVMRHEQESTRFLFFVFRMMNNSSRYLFIFNPAADKGRASRKAEWLKALVADRNDSIMATTDYAGHAGEIARSGIRESSCLIACGGDGTLHEVVNAVAGEERTVGILPIGSANDFIKTLNPRKEHHKGIAHLFEGTSKKVDLGSVSFGVANHRYFVNSLGIGFTGRVAKAVKRLPWLKGELGYVYALFSVLAGYSSLNMHITITLEDSVLELHEPVFAFTVSNGKIEGGKFIISPHAELSDGLLDICILKDIRRYEFFRFVLKYLNGTHINDPKILYCKAKAVTLTLMAPEVMHMDGEVYDNILGKVGISVLPDGIRLLCDLLPEAEP
ncbi:diacylglycerol/lipid kinase family protein [Pelodictyon phaeoclathratiforme]|nr:diacylglycerol kinase family protein [Pelodictyon phaeoclathratiforme]